MAPQTRDLWSKQIWRQINAVLLVLYINNYFNNSPDRYEAIPIPRIIGDTTRGRTDGRTDGRTPDNEPSTTIRANNNNNNNNNKNNNKSQSGFLIWTHRPIVLHLRISSIGYS